MIMAKFCPLFVQNKTFFDFILQAECYDFVFLSKMNLLGT